MPNSLASFADMKLSLSVAFSGVTIGMYGKRRERRIGGRKGGVREGGREGGRGTEQNNYGSVHSHS